MYKKFCVQGWKHEKNYKLDFYNEDTFAVASISIPLNRKETEDGTITNC